MNNYKSNAEVTDIIRESEKTQKCTICKSTQIAGKIYNKYVCKTCASDALELKK